MAVLVAIGAVLTLVRRTRWLALLWRLCWMARIFLAGGRWTGCSWGACRTMGRNVSIANAALTGTTLSIALWLLCVRLRLLCVCLGLLSALLTFVLGKGGDGCQQ